MKLSTDQQHAIDWLKDHSGLLIATPGAGKTRTVLGLLEQTDKRGLIIAPANVARRTWSEEAYKVRHTNHVTPWDGFPKERKELAELCKRFGSHLVVSYELAPKFLKEHDPSQFDTVIFDEVTRLKTPTGIRYRAIANALKDHPHKIGLTGTPTSNHFYQLYGQLKITAGLPVIYEDWLENYFTPRRIRVATKRGTPIYTTTWMDRYNSYDLIKPLLEPRVHRMPAPTDEPMRVIDHWVALPKDALKAHEEENLIIRQRQVAQGRLYVNDSAAMPVHDAKRDRLRGLLDDLQGEPVLIFYQFRHDLDAIAFAARKTENTLVAPEGPKELAYATEEWNAKQLPILAVHPQSAGHGLNLQAGGHQIIWYGLPEDAELYEQGNRRLARQGQTETVMVHRILAEKTVDEAIAQRLETKRGKAAAATAIH